MTDTPRQRVALTLPAPTGSVADSIQLARDCDALGWDDIWLARLFRWKYRKKLDKIQRKYLSGERNGENFARHKVYRLLLLKVPE